MAGRIGNWDLYLTENFQNISRALKVKGKDIPIRDAKLEGNRTKFSAGG